jgi:hypothetical protein
MIESSSICGNVEMILMMLNRAVVIDCPQLGIPWIMGTLQYRSREYEGDRSDCYPEKDIVNRGETKVDNVFFKG